jgi:hypothetical protein
MLLWLILWLTASGTAFATSFYIFSRANCETVTVTGGTIYEFSCHPIGSNPPGGAPSDLVALGLFLTGLMMVFFSVRHYLQNK